MLLGRYSINYNDQKLIMIKKIFRCNTDDRNYMVTYLMSFHGDIIYKIIMRDITNILKF